MFVSHCFKEWFGKQLLVLNYKGLTRAAVVRCRGALHPDVSP